MMMSEIEPQPIMARRGTNNWQRVNKSWPPPHPRCVFDLFTKLDRLARQSRLSGDLPKIGLGITIS